MMKVVILRLMYSVVPEFRIFEPRLNLPLIEFLLTSCSFYCHSNELHQAQHPRVKLKILEIKESIKDRKYDIQLVPEIFPPLFQLLTYGKSIKLLISSKQYDDCKEAVQNSST
jgi:hypothetical protein